MIGILFFKTHWRKISAALLAMLIALGIIFVGPMMAGTSGVFGGYGCTYCTQTQGGWHNADLLDDNFATVFPSGLLVGGTYTMQFSSADAVQTYLPAGETPAVLTQNHSNPTSTESGNLGGQVTALKINVEFADAGYGKVGSACPIGELCIDDTGEAFDGITVDTFLAVAEAVLGGDTSVLTPYGASITDVVETATAINENFVDCTTDNGYLTDCPD